MTLRKLQKETEDQLQEVLSKVLGTERAVTAEVIYLIHQRMVLMEKIHDFDRRLSDGVFVSYIDMTPEQIEKLNEKDEPKPS